MNELQVFQNNQFGQVRVIEKDGEPWFVGKDIAEALGYANTKDALITHVDDEDKHLLQRSEITTIENHLPKSAFPCNFVAADVPNRGLTIINESGLYSLVLSSKLPSARQFKHWVTSEIIPSIRKHGAYMTGDTLDRMISSPEFGIKLLTELQNEREKRQALQSKVTEDAPKVLFADSVAASKQSILVGELSKLLKQNGVDIGQNRLFAKLRDEGYLGTKGEYYNMPTQKAMNLNLFEIKETTVTNADGSIRITRTPKITGKGQCYFVNRYLNQA